MSSKPDHFKGKDALSHVAETQADGIITSSEIHGVEPPGHWVALLDSARDMGIIFLLCTSIFHFLHLTLQNQVKFSLLFALGWGIWKMGRSAWLAWSRLERLHRMLAQEKWEIEHHRAQEREELKVLYSAKGFEGKLLEDVVDVLMADGERLLKVMVEEEMRLSLENQEHPLKQSTGSALGSLITALACSAALFLLPDWGVVVTALTMIAIASGYLAYLYNNHMVPAIVWSVGLAILAYGTFYYLTQYFS